MRLGNQLQSLGYLLSCLCFLKADRCLKIPDLLHVTSDVTKDRGLCLVSSELRMSVEAGAFKQSSLKKET